MHQLKEIGRIVQGLRQLAATHLRAAAILREIVSEMGETLGLDMTTGEPTPLPVDVSLAESFTSRNPIVEADACAVCWKGKTCFLGNTLSFKLFARLACRPNHFLSHDLLLDEVWECRVTKEAIRSVVKTLKQKLRQAGMEDLAAAIDGHRRECYRLNLGRFA